MRRKYLSWMLLLIATVSLSLAAGCCSDGYRAVTVTQLVLDRDRYDGQRVRVAGAVVREPAWNSNGAIFWIEDVTGESPPIRVVYAGGRPPMPNADATATGSWVGTVVLFGGVYDGGLLRSNNLAVRQAGPYRATPSWSTSATIRAAEQAHPADFGKR